MRRKILLFIKTPPPYTGATYVNTFVRDSEKLNQYFYMKSIDVSYNDSLTSLGKVSLNKFFRILKNYLKLIRTLILYKPSIVYFQISHIGFGFFRDLVAVIIIKVISGCKIVYHIHGIGYQQQASKNRLFKKAYKYAFKNEKVICISKASSNDVKPYLSNKPFIVYNTIEPLNNVGAVNVKNNKLRIVYLSNLIREKGIIVFMNSLLYLKNYNFECFIIGNEADITAKEVNAFIDKNSLNGKAKYHGPVYGQEKFEILNSTDIFVFPTYYPNENSPLVIIEAMRAGVAVVSTNQGGIPELIEHGKNGLIAKKKNAEDLAINIEKLILNSELREKLGEKGKEKFREKYQFEAFEKNMKEVFEGVLNSNNK